MAKLATLSGVFTSGDWNQAASDYTLTNLAGTQLTMGTTGTSVIVGTVDTWDLSASTWSVKFQSMPTGTGLSHGMELRSLNANTNMLRFWRTSNTGGGEWSFTRTIGGVGVDAGVVTQTHLTSNPYVRMRESGGTLFLDTSADGTTWNNQLSIAASTLPLTTFRQRFQISAVPTGNWVLQQLNGVAAPGTLTSVDASAVDAANTWLTTTNVFTSNDVYATNVGTTQNVEYPLDLGGFDTGFSAITAGSTINAVRVTIEGKTGTAARAQIKGEMFDGATAITPTLALTNLTAADANYTFKPTATLAQLQSAAMFVRVTNKRIVSQASTTSVDYVKVEAEWTAPVGGVTHNISATLAGTTASVTAALPDHQGAAPRAITAAPVSAATSAHAKASTVPTDFSNTGLWENVNGASPTSTTVTLPATSAGATSSTYGLYDLTSSEVSWKIDQLHTQSDTDVQTSIYLRLNHTNSSYIRFLITSLSTTVYMRYNVSGSVTTVGSYAWSATRPWMKFSEAAGVVTWWDSADGVAWTSKGTWTHGGAFDLTSLEVNFQTLDGANGASGSSIISHVNVAGTPEHLISATPAITASSAAATVVDHQIAAPLAVTSASASAALPIRAAAAPLAITSASVSAPLADHAIAAPLTVTAAPVSAAATTTTRPKTDTVPGDFTDAAIWETHNTTNGTGQVTLPANSLGPNATTLPLYDLKSSSFYFRIDQLHTQSSNDVQTSIYLRVNHLTASYLRFLITSSSTTVYLRYAVASSVTTVATYAWSSSRPWLRFREMAGTVYWDDSVDGVSWTNQAAWVHGDVIDLTALEPGFQALDGLNGASGSSIISHVNTPLVEHAIAAPSAITAAPVTTAALTAAISATQTGTAAATAVIAVEHVIAATRATTAAPIAAASLTGAVSAAQTSTAATTATVTVDHAIAAPSAITAAPVTAGTITEAVYAISATLATTAAATSAAAVTYAIAAPLAVTAAPVVAGTVTEAQYAIDAAQSVTAATSASVTVDHTLAAPRAVTAGLTAIGDVVQAEYLISGPQAATAASTASASVNYAISAALAVTSDSAGAATTGEPEWFIDASSPVTAAATAAIAVDHPVAAPLAVSNARAAVTAVNHVVAATRSATSGISSVAAVTEAIWPIAATLPVAAAAACAIVANHAISASLAAVAVQNTAATTAEPEYFVDGAVLVSANAQAYAYVDHQVGITTSALGTSTAALATEAGGAQIEISAALGVTADPQSRAAFIHSLSAPLAVTSNTIPTNLTREVFAESATAATAATSVAALLTEADWELSDATAVTAAAAASVRVTHPIAAPLAVTAPRPTVLGKVHPVSATLHATVAKTSSARMQVFLAAVRSVTAGKTAAAQPVREGIAALNVTTNRTASIRVTHSIRAELLVTAEPLSDLGLQPQDVIPDGSVRVGNIGGAVSLDRDSQITTLGGGGTATLEREAVSVTIASREWP